MNKNFSHLLRTTLAALAIAAGSISPALADDGHNHDAGSGAAQGEASPRVEAHSELFEIVGIVEKGQMKVYLDRYATNEPITGAKIDFEAGTHKGSAAPQPDGTYLIKFDALSKAGELPFSFTVAAGSDTDLLAGELHIEDPHAADQAAGRPWLRWAAMGAAALAALAAALIASRVLARHRTKDIQ